MARRNRNDAKNSEEFKKEMNREVTQTDQKDARGRGNGKRNSRRGQSDTIKKNSNNPDIKGYYSYEKQDFAWYNKIPTVTQAAGNLPWVLWNGEPVAKWTGVNDYVEFAVPGFMMFKTTPSFGLTNKQTDPLNLAAEKLWSYMFHTVSGQTFADAPDMMLYLTAMVEVYDYITWLERLYGTVKKWSNENLYTPKYLIEAQGVSYDSLVANMADFYGGINLLITQASALSVPNEFSLFMRRAFLYQDYYTEGLSQKSQMYFYAPQGFHTFDIPVGSEKGGQLKFNSLESLWPNPATYQELIQFGSNMISFLLADSEVKKLSSLVLRAWGSSGIIRLNEMSQDHQATVLYNLAVLEQFKNASIIPFAALDPDSLNLTQDPSLNMLVYQPFVTKPSTVTEMEHALSAAAYSIISRSKVPMASGLEQPGIETNIENSRLMLGKGSNSTSTKGYVQCSSEIITGLVVGMLSVNGAGEVNFFANEYYTETTAKLNGNADVKKQLNQVLEACTKMNWQFGCFKFHPALKYTLMDTTNDVLSVVTDGFYLFDFDNYAYVDQRSITEMSKACMYNLLYSETVAKAWNGNT